MTKTQFIQKRGVQKRVISAWLPRCFLQVMGWKHYPMISAYLWGIGGTRNSPNSPWAWNQSNQHNFQRFYPNKCSHGINNSQFSGSFGRSLSNHYAPIKHFLASWVPGPQHPPHWELCEFLMARGSCYKNPFPCRNLTSPNLVHHQNLEALSLLHHASQALMMHLVRKCAISATAWAQAISHWHIMIRVGKPWSHLHILF